MTGTMAKGQALPFTSGQDDALGNPSHAVLSEYSFTSSDTNVFAVGVNATDPSTGTCVAVNAGTAHLLSSAKATEPDGTVHQISGSDTVVVTDVVPPIPPAAVLTVKFGAPFIPPPPPPVNPPTA